MAHPEEMTPLLPDTLPEDFSDWDGDAPQAPSEEDAAYTGSEAPKSLGQSDYFDSILANFVDAPSVWRSDSPDSWPKEPSSVAGSRSEWDAVYTLAKAPKPVAQSAPAPSVVEKPREARPAMPAARPQAPVDDTAEVSPSDAWSKLEASHAAKESSAKPGRQEAPAADAVRKLSAHEVREADEAISQLFTPKTAEVEEEPKPAKSKRVLIAAASGGSILVAAVLFFTLGHHGTKAMAEPAAQPTTVITDAEMTTTNTPKPSASEPLAQPKSQAAAAAQPTAQSQAAAEDDQASSTPAVTDSQTKMMNDQLSAPNVISQDMRKQAAGSVAPPPPAGTTEAVNLGGGSAMPNVFNGRSESVVQAPPAKPLAISSGIANGMLIKKTPPVYPTIAKTARVSGTVELHAVIAKNGTIKDLRVLSGPIMLQQSAFDAVRSWRYKPYTLNNEPTEVETTINVVFSLTN